MISTRDSRALGEAPVIWREGFLLHFGLKGPMYFVYCRLYPLCPPDTTAVLGFNLAHLSTIKQHCIAGTGLPNHLMGEVSWDPKRRRS